MKKTIGIGSEDPGRRVWWLRAPRTQGLKRVDTPELCQQHFKRIPIELLPPHKFNKVGIQLGPARSTLPLVPLLGPTPHGLWWHAFVDPQSECCGSLSNAGIPCCQWYYRRPISQKRRWYPAKRRRIPLWNSHKEAVLGLHINSSKHPLGVHHPANVGLPPGECGLVNLHSVVRAT